jgi:hypothetical protein
VEFDFGRRRRLDGNISRLVWDLYGQALTGFPFLASRRLHTRRRTRLVSLWPTIYQTLLCMLLSQACKKWEFTSTHGMQVGPSWGQPVHFFGREIIMCEDRSRIDILVLYRENIIVYPQLLCTYKLGPSTPVHAIFGRPNKQHIYS